MKMNKIKHFILPESTNSLYEKEAISSIGLTREIAEKINELVDAYNKFSNIDLEWKQTQEGIIRKGVLYMKDNLLNSLNDLLVLFRDSGYIDNRIKYHCDFISERLDNLLGTVKEGSTTADAELIDIRYGLDNVTYSNAGDSIRANLTKILEAIDFVTSIEWQEYPNPLVIITSHFLKFLPISKIELLNKNYYFVIEGYDESYSHIFTFEYKNSIVLGNEITSERVKFIKIKLLRNDGENITLEEKEALSYYLLFPESSVLDKTLTLSDVAPDSQRVGNAIKNEYENLLKHTAKNSITWSKVLDYRFESHYCIFNLNSKIQLLSPDYFFAIKGYTADLTFIYDSGWINKTELLSLFDYIKSDRIKYIKVLLQTSDSSNIADYNSISLFDIFEPLVLPSIPEESGSTFEPLSLNDNIRVINHRGFNFEAPENTMVAFKLSIEKGYRYIETDVQFTKDNIPVLLHDETIDRTSNGSGNIENFTYEELLNYDFGSWFDSKFAGTKIPTFEEFLSFCKYTGVHPYIELKYGGMTESNIIKLLSIVKRYGMLNKVTFISSEITFLQIIKENCDFLRIGLSCEAITDEIIQNVNGLKTDSNDVFITVYTYNYSSEDVSNCLSNNIPLELWVVNGPTAIELIDPYITGITTDNYDVYKALFDKVVM